MTTRKTLPISEEVVNQGYVEMSLELLDQFIEDGVEEIIFTANNGRYFSYMDEWVLKGLYENPGVYGEGRWMKRMKLTEMIKA